ncbi:unnamed protein product [Linum trigynum]|uniref:Uncharacterized protein n=1 Tax=Linum trigynum TaxID=586398 RepID=A0AAV2EST0_9ROSI
MKAQRHLKRAMTKPIRVGATEAAPARGREDLECGETRVRVGRAQKPNDGVPVKRQLDREAMENDAASPEVLSHHSPRYMHRCSSR